MLQLTGITKSYGERPRARRRDLRRAARPPHRLRRRQRRRQDHDHAHHPRRARRGRRHGHPRRRAGDGIRPPPLRLHARGARPLPEDEGARADRLPRPPARLLASGCRDRAPPRCSSGSDSASAWTTTSRRSRSATSSAPRSPRRSCTTPRCSILDEPFSGLDPLAVDVVAGVLQAARRGRRRRALLVAPARRRRAAVRRPRDHRRRHDPRGRRARRAARASTPRSRFELISTGDAGWLRGRARRRGPRLRRRLRRVRRRQRRDGAARAAPGRRAGAMSRASRRSIRPSPRSSRRSSSEHRTERRSAAPPTAVESVWLVAEREIALEAAQQGVPHLDGHPLPRRARPRDLGRHLSAQDRPPARRSR